jgi:hypothetical protein
MGGLTLHLSYSHYLYNCHWGEQIKRQNGRGTHRVKRKCRLCPGSGAYNSILQASVLKLKLSKANFLATKQFQSDFGDILRGSDDVLGLARIGANFQFFWCWDCLMTLRCAFRGRDGNTVTNWDRNF